MADPVVVESWHLPRALSDEALRLLTTLPMDEIERRLRMDGPAGHERPTDEQLDNLFVEIDGSGETQSWRAFARAVLAHWGAADGEVVELPPRPPLMEPPAHLALERYGVTWDGSSDKPLLTRMADGYWTPWHVAADLLERQAAAAPVARLPEDAQVIEPANRTILVPVPTPIPVSERLPGPEDCQPWPDEPDADPWCWLGSNFFDGGWEWEQRSVQFLRHYGNEYTHWLPAHALPLPEVE